MGLFEEIEQQKVGRAYQGRVDTVLAELDESDSKDLRRALETGLSGRAIERALEARGISCSNTAINTWRRRNLK